MRTSGKLWCVKYRNPHGIEQVNYVYGSTPKVAIRRAVERDSAADEVTLGGGLLWMSEAHWQGALNGVVTIFKVRRSGGAG